MSHTLQESRKIRQTLDRYIDQDKNTLEIESLIFLLLDKCTTNERAQIVSTIVDVCIRATKK